MSALKVSGFVTLKIYDKSGVLKSECSGPNTITSAGLAQLALLAGDATAVPFTYLAVGTDDTAVASTDTALGAEITDTGLARASATVTRTTTTVSNDTLRLTHTWTATGVKTIEEVGIFNASTAGTMLGRKLSGSKVTANGDEVYVVYDIRFA
jgi:hypothetical protein